MKTNITRKMAATMQKIPSKKRKYSPSLRIGFALKVLRIWFDVSAATSEENTKEVNIPVAE